MTDEPEQPSDEAQREKRTRRFPAGCLVSLIVLGLVFYFIVSICSRA